MVSFWDAIPYPIDTSSFCQKSGSAGRKWISHITLIRFAPKKRSILFSSSQLVSAENLPKRTDKMSPRANYWCRQREVNSDQGRFLFQDFISMTQGGTEASRQCETRTGHGTRTDGFCPGPNNSELFASVWRAGATRQNIAGHSTT